MLKKVLVIILILSMFFPIRNLSAYTNETYNNVISYEYRLGDDSPHPLMDLLMVHFVDEVHRVNVIREDGLEVSREPDQFGLACNVTYTLEAWAPFNTFLGTDTVTVTGIQNTANDCPEGSPGAGGGDGGGGDDCGCIFNTPGWDRYMGKVDQIINRIPSPPNWQSVANTMRDTIVPRMVNDFGDLLGRAPSTPDLEVIRAPSQPRTPSTPNAPSSPILSDRNITDSEPSFNEPSGLDDSAFNLSDLKDDAEVIEFEEDPTGGFEISNPVDSLPELPSDDFPIPGETNAGDYGEHQPTEEDIEYPDAPVDEGIPIPDDPPEPDDGDYDAPIPEQPENEVPTPGDDFGDLPLPGGDYDAPIPDDGEGYPEGSHYYKDQPD